ncbi:hypothetical protein J3Q64DRAFT_1775273 [Phycomyces blakesleeanus]|uniref:Autophagy-related protein 17 n=1 Tax=Phycomyces blakesleeanus TaxID=4837 RepID=A0ABR3AK94_PHYBL
MSFTQKRSSDGLSDSDDSWERAAHSFRHEPPSLYARQTTILEAQNAKLVITSDMLQKQLDKAKSELALLEKEYEEEHNRMSQISAEYDESVNSTVNLAQDIFEVSTKDKTALVSLDTDRTSLETYIAADSALSEKLQHALYLWHRQLPMAEETEDASKARQCPAIEIETIVEAFQTVECLNAQAEATCKGYEAKTQTIERELQKLNHLPQLLPILNSSIASYQEETRRSHQAAVNTQENELEPLLQRISSLSIRSPLTETNIRKDYETMEELSLQLEKICQTLLNQRACQQLLTFGYETDDKHQKQQQYVYQALKEELEEEYISHHAFLEKAGALDWPNTGLQDRTNATDIMAWAQDLLGFEDDKLLSNESIVEKVKVLLQENKTWYNQWLKSLDAHMDVVDKLDEAEKRMTDTLYSNSASTNELILLPQTYTETQKELEKSTIELGNDVAELEEELELSTRFEHKKELFTLFFNDPKEFEAHIASASGS